MSRRYVGLDGLRGIAAICVVFHHGMHFFGQASIPAHAQLAVDFFFMLSAFVIADAYAARRVAGLSAARFMAIRWIRLFPMHLLGLVAGLAVALTVPTGLDAGTLWTAFFLAITLFAPIWTSRTDSPSAFVLNGPAWSLYFEWIANIAWVTVLVRLGRGALLAIVVASGIVYCLVAVRRGGVGWGYEVYALALGLPRVTFPYVVGLTIWTFRDYLPATISSAGFLLIAAAFVLLLGFPTFRVHIDLAAYELAVVCVGFPAIIFLGAAQVPARLDAILMWLGRISYPLYIIHFPILRLVSSRSGLHTDSRGEAFLWVVGEVVAALLLADALQRVWDAPVRDRLTRHLLRTNREWPPREARGVN
jgi:peptidoglycan/LPS O-acetylase OafA/YrhL